jgi:hypothetical protein
MSRLFVKSRTLCRIVKETSMSHRRMVLFLALLTAFALGQAAEASASEPWWQLTVGARPMHLSQSQSEVQELEPAPGTVTIVKIDETPVACVSGASSAFFCSFFGLSADETAADIQESLEAPAAYGPGNVEVVEDSDAPGRFLVTSTGALAKRVVSPLTVASPGPAHARVLTEGGSGRLIVTATNIGDAPIDGAAAPVTLIDELPAGLAAYEVEGVAGPLDKRGPLSCEIEGTSKVICNFEGELSPYEALEAEIYVSLQDSTPGPLPAGTVRLSGGTAADAQLAQVVTVSDEPTPFGIESYSAKAEQEGGAPATQAASHPFQFTTDIQFDQGRMTPGRRHGLAFEQPVQEQPAQPRNLRVTLPPGLVGNASDFPTCTFLDFSSQAQGINKCPASTAVGAASATIIEGAVIGVVRAAVPVFNIEPNPGEPARFGFMVEGVPVVLDATAPSSDGYRARVEVRNASQLAELLASTVTFWGVPADPRHDESRGWGCLLHETFAGDCVRPPQLAAGPLLRLPTSCEAVQRFEAEAEPWNTLPGSVVAKASVEAPPVEGCNRVPFTPSIRVQPDTSRAESPTGLSFHLTVPQEPSEDPEGIAESDLRSTNVLLPRNLQINTAGARGLEACSEDQVGFQGIDPGTGEARFSETPVECPPASKLGTVQVNTPLLDEPLVGSVYQATQGSNPFGSLFALYIVADAPEAGVHLRLASRISPTPQGLLASVEESPQLPFEELTLNFFGGAGAPLATSGCGRYETDAEITPWSGNPPAIRSSEFVIDRGADGGSCQDPQPFLPSFLAGTEFPLAGSYSPFMLQVGREDGTQQLGRIDTVLPPGLTGRLAGIPYCQEDAIRRAQSLDEPGAGAVELSHPSCPASSQIGEVSVASGVGPNPYVVDGRAYLAGPYRGAPLSLVVVTPAVAGPFDLGVVAVRVALEVDPRTAQITARSDMLPTEVQGVPLDIRRISLKMNRPKFTLNPTSCAAMSVRATAVSTLGAAASLASRFQADGCKALGFKPKLSLQLSGGTARTKFPALRAVLRTRKGDANLKRTVVTLPPGEQIENAHIVQPCTRVQFNASECPRRTILGHATASSPLLDRPLRGPVYFRSNGGARELPDIVADLRGQIHVVLVGYVDAVHGRIRTRFMNLPDAAVSRFTLNLFGGKRGLLVNNRNICARRYRSSVELEAHNGRVRQLRQAVRIRCGREIP